MNKTMTNGDALLERMVAETPKDSNNACKEKCNEHAACVKTCHDFDHGLDYAETPNKRKGKTFTASPAEMGGEDDQTLDGGDGKQLVQENHNTSFEHQMDAVLEDEVDDNVVEVNIALCESIMKMDTFPSNKRVKACVSPRSSKYRRVLRSQNLQTSLRSALRSNIKDEF